MKPNTLPANERFLRLPDDPDQQEEALKAARRDDPDAQIHKCAQPTGAVLEVRNVDAHLAAKMTLTDIPGRKIEKT